MSNVIPAYLPKAHAATTSVLMGYLRIKTLYFFNPANIADTVVVKDAAGNMIWEGRCEVANQSQVFVCPREIEVNGYQITALDSGTIYIYYV